MLIPSEKEREKNSEEKSSPRQDSLPIHLELKGDLVTSVSKYVEDCRQIIFQKIDSRAPAGEQLHLQSQLMDQLIITLFRRGFEDSQVKGVLPMPIALFAQGGYGRSELNLYSDVDLLFVYEGKSSASLEYITKKMLYPLWDAKVEVGYSIRTIKECDQVMREDIRAMSSMLDARFLTGEEEIAQKFFQFLESRVSSTRALRQFVKEKVKETEERLKRFGGSVYVIEPNLKESEGGLRDWHSLGYFARMATKATKIEEWVYGGLLTDEEGDRLRRSLEFIWEVRNRLHRRSGKIQDQLNFEAQEPIAHEMGFETGGGKLGVEKFMQAYYGHAANLNRLRIEVTRRIMRPPKSTFRRLMNRFRPSLSPLFVNMDGKVLPRNYKKLESHPVEIVRAFWLAQKKRLGMHDDFKSWISRHLHLVDSKFRESPEVCRMIREMIADISGIGQTLWEMHDCRFLGDMIPEFGEILHQTQHDVYHVYTLDTHSIKAVQELSRLKRGDYDDEFPAFKKALEEIKFPSELVLGILFHDIGKGKGGRHSELGAKIAKKIMKRLGYERESIERVEFLVLSHLLMPHLSQRRDLGDSTLISQFAGSMEDIENLNELFVLTWADIRAVGPEVWTPWKGSLLRQLYKKTRQVMERGAFTTERAVVVMKGVIEKTLDLAPKRFPIDNLERFLNAMPPRYFLAYTPVQILEHFDILHASPPEEVIFHQTPNLKGNFNEVLIYTLNSPLLFEKVSGVMAANQVNILAFEQFFDTKGEALLLLRVTDQLGRLLEEERRFRNLQKDLKDIILSKMRLENYYEKRRRSSYLSQSLSKSRRRRPPRVEIDQDVSPYYTVIDIFADDRIGLLYDIARVMRQLNLYVEVSKISTKVDQVADVFYVKDVFGDKIHDAVKLKVIKQSILGVLEEPEK